MRCRIDMHSVRISRGLLGGVAIVLAWSCLPLMAEPRTWTSNDGRKIQAELVAYDAAGKTVKIKLTTGTEATLPLDRLSAEDQAWINAEQEKLAEAKARAGKTLSYTTDGADKRTYHVYYPTAYDPAKPPALLVVFSPGGDGKGMLKQVTSSCEKMGWLGVGCDTLRNHMSNAEGDAIWNELLPHIEKTVPHNRDLLYLGGMSGGALRAYDYSEVTVRPWKGILAFGGWLNYKQELDCPRKMAVAIVNGDQDKGANGWVEADSAVLKKAGCKIETFSFPGGHVVAPPDVILKAMEWLQAETVPGERLPKGKRNPMKDVK